MSKCCVEVVAQEEEGKERNRVRDRERNRKKDKEKNW